MQKQLVLSISHRWLWLCFFLYLPIVPLVIYLFNESLTGHGLGRVLDSNGMSSCFAIRR
ncbi:hypothetical protein LJ361_13850 [Brucella sp. JSBI001]|nr:hypothetical protein [Brucella sp. JSBI001]UZD68244.1 hypothetical protein LJ361_13850 [Brucella sp. JSBI001]